MRRRKKIGAGLCRGGPNLLPVVVWVGRRLYLGIESDFAQFSNFIVVFVDFARVAVVTTGGAVVVATCLILGL